MHKISYLLATTIITILALTACAGAKQRVLVEDTVYNQKENTFDGGYSIYVGSASSSTRNRTFELSAEELENITIASNCCTWRDYFLSFPKMAK